jgi:protein-disulfide isomerase
MKIALSPVANGIVSASALIGLGLLLGRAAQPRPRAPEMPPAVAEIEADAWRALTEDAATIGAPAAALTILTFSDFQCPWCAQLAASFRELERRNPGKVRMVYRHFPLDMIHAHAREAAIAAECARDQNRFGAFHDTLFAAQDSIGTRAWEHFAAAAGVPDPAALLACMQADSPKARIEHDVREAERLGVAGTPTIWVNGMLFDDAPTPERLQALIPR